MNTFLTIMLVVVCLAWGAREIMVERQINEWREIARSATALAREAVAEAERLRMGQPVMPKGRSLELVVDNERRVLQ
jgi:membrane protein required for beta-lactamase induction